MSSSFVTLRTVAHQAPLSLGFPRQEYWSGLPLPAPGDLPNPGIKPASHVSPELADVFLTASTTWEILHIFLKKLHSRVSLFVTPWTVDHQAPLSLGFPRQEHWSELPFPSPGDFFDPGIKILCLLHRRWILYPLSHRGSQTELLLLHVKHYYKHLPFLLNSLNTSMWYCFQLPDSLADDTVCQKQRLVEW